MIKLYQSKPNNCFSTCIGCLLGLSQTQIENFPPHDCGDWVEEYQYYLNSHYKYGMLMVKYNKYSVPIDAFCILTGRSPYTDGIDHSVIGIGKEIYFDPKPENKGLLGKWEDWEFCYLLPIFQNDNYQRIGDIITRYNELKKLI